MKIKPIEWLALDKYSKKQKLINAMVGSINLSAKLSAKNKMEAI